MRKSESKLRAGAYASSAGVALLLAACLGIQVAHAQAIMRTPTISLPSRTPTISPSIAARAVSLDRGPRVAPTGHISARMAPTTVLPYAHYSPNLYPACAAAYRDADGECLAQPNGTGDGSGKSARKSAGKGRGNNTPVAANLRTFANEFVAEIDSTLSAAEADELARRHGLTRLSSENFPLIGARSVCSASPTVDRMRRRGANSRPTPACARFSRISATCSRIRSQPCRPRATRRNMR